MQNIKTRITDVKIKDLIFLKKTKPLNDHTLLRLSRYGEEIINKIRLRYITGDVG